MGYKRRLYLLALLLAPVLVQAQFRLPTMDVEAKFNFNILPSTISNTVDNMQTTGFSGALNIHINQYIGLGWFYQRSISGTTKYQNRDGGNQSSKDAQILFSGTVLRISTGRGNKWRPYLALSYSKVEIVQSNGGYNVAAKTNAVGANLGIMRRLGNRLYWNVMEAGVKMVKEPPFWFGSKDTNVSMFEVKSGFTYNFGKRK